MHDRSCPPALLAVLGVETPSEPIYSFHCHGHTTFPCQKEEGVMFLQNASISLSFFLLLIHLSSYLLTKLFTFLLRRAISKGQGDVQLGPLQHENEPVSTSDEHLEKDGLVADAVCREDQLFFYTESSAEDSLLTEQGKDSNEKNSLELEDTFVSESRHGSPPANLDNENLGTESSNDPMTDVPTPSDCPSPIILASENVTCEDTSHGKETHQNREGKNFWEHEKFLVVNNSDTESKTSFRVEEVHGDHKENFGGSLTGESTSKSSIEWRSSAILRDSETEYPFSSSSRRSSSNWESYALFRRYDEEMMFFDRVSAQKLSETESLRSIKFQPRSVSQRIVHRLVTKNKNSSRGGRDPYLELESAYVAQICLTWEALNWNHTNFRRVHSNRDMEGYCCPARIAQQFQQFDVLLQRFIENEPYERGRRPEVYARVRISSPKLLQVPEFKDSEADGGKEEMISSTEFLKILEDAIRTFMNFLKADKQSYYQTLKSLIKKKSSSVDPTLLHLLKKANKKKKRRLKDLGRQRKCLKKRRIKEEREMEILMSLIDMKVVSRVLRMPDINSERLHWCDEKMSKVRVGNGKIERDSSPLFFPVH
ncbi:putative Laminin subunit beta-1 [Cocos nucifera]|uniref:Putative Laminin subunit beta-1 n=1 Tax=Cocos nucifera TaxID=13894 RepID=A0A8K0HYI3_COCNU|nr:putative Laminin subunit beta-1 [Cocos nucifera]